jgi:Rps23 Pro-64 3,4-dihydroxylase Tpa1-like proline 4-hydroxylase
MLQSSHSQFELAPSINVQELRHRFAVTGRVQIRPFLTGDAALHLRDYLLVRKGWELALMTGPRLLYFAEKQLDSMPANQRQGLLKLAAPAAEKGQRHAFQRILVTDDETGPKEQDTPLSRFSEFMSSAPVLDMLRTVTNFQEIAFADAQATKYCAGHFATIHHDRAPGSSRLAAYVFGLTERWRPEWGGLLMFHDSQGDVERALVPRLNALNLFRVPQDHSVSEVAPYCDVPRLSVTGWLRSSQSV